MVRSLDGRVFQIDEQTLEKYRIPDEQVKQLTGNYTLPPAPAPPACPAQAAALPGIDVQVPDSLKDQVLVERGPGNSVVIHLGPGVGSRAPSNSK